jgi:hypothetical protein
MNSSAKAKNLFQNIPDENKRACSKILYRTFQKIMSLRAAALALWRRGNLFLSEICIISKSRGE